MEGRRPHGKLGVAGAPAPAALFWTCVDYATHGSMVYCHGWPHHGWWGGPSVYYPNIPYRYNQRERSRLVFREGRAVSIEQET